MIFFIDLLPLFAAIGPQRTLDAFINLPPKQKDVHFVWKTLDLPNKAIYWELKKNNTFRSEKINCFPSLYTMFKNKELEVTNHNIV